MPTVAQNVHRWSRHNWDHEGHRWSPGATRAGTELMWWRSIRPRIHRHLPAGTILEIAPGCGRWTDYLIGECARLIGVDVTERCVDVCRQRFAGRAAEFWVNDGHSLPTVATGSVDLAVSLDSLVHVEEEPIRAYVTELARTLKPGGAAFLHHSNLGAYAAADGAIPRYIRERYWRAPSVSARLVRTEAHRVGLICVTQELINWVGHDSDVERNEIDGPYVPLTDCFSVLVRPADGDADPEPTRIYMNRQFVLEWRQLVDMSHTYAAAAHLATAGPAPASRPPRRPWRGLRSKAAGWIFALREPLVRAVAAGRCPDCSARLAVVEGSARCAPCSSTFLVR